MSESDLLERAAAILDERISALGINAEGDMIPGELTRLLISDFGVDLEQLGAFAVVQSREFLRISVNRYPEDFEHALGVCLPSLYLNAFQLGLMTGRLATLDEGS